jgi:hypothetical protein
MVSTSFMDSLVSHASVRNADSQGRVRGLKGHRRVSPHAFINGGNRFKNELLAEDNENKRLIVESIKIVFCPSGTFDLEFVGNKNLSDPTDLRTICCALEHFFLPAALCNINDDALVIWNPAFQKRAGVSEKELAHARLRSLIFLDESYGGSVLGDQDSEHIIRFVPCVLKKPLTNELVHGCALRRNDGWVLAMLGLPTGDVAFEGFIHGRFVGREEERNRLDNSFMIFSVQKFS